MKAFNKTIFSKLNKLSEPQIQKIFESVTAQNEMLSSIIESLSTGLLIVDKEGRLLLSNKASERFIPFSVRPDDIRDEATKLFEIVSDADISAFIKNCQEQNKSNVSGEFTVTTSGGSVRFITITVSPLVRAESLSGSIITVRDITEKRNQEILLHRMESLAGLTNLAASVAHEIKNPLGAISIHIQLIQKAVKAAREGGGLLPDEKFMEKYLGVVNEEIENLNKIVMNFLFAVRPVNAELELVNPNPLLEKFTEFFLPEFTAKGVDVKSVLCKENVRLLIDQKLFREVIINLAQNALAAIEEKFSNTVIADGTKPAGGGLLEIHSKVRGDKFIIAVKDNGNGMSEKTLEHVFEPYYTTKANGTGLGLTMVYKIIKEFQGDIQVESHVGEGTAFIITLPVPQTDRKLLTCKI